MSVFFYKCMTVRVHLCVCLREFGSECCVCAMCMCVFGECVCVCVCVHVCVLCACVVHVPV